MFSAKVGPSPEDDIIYNAICKKRGELINTGTNCGELVFISLIKLALIPESSSNERILHHLKYVANITQLQNNFYHKPVEITISPF